MKAGGPRGLYVLVDDAPGWRLDPVAQAEAALEGGARAIQLRAKGAGDARILGWAEEIARLAGRVGALFVVNDRFDLALAAGAGGVHLGQEDVPPGRIPAALRARLVVGRSSHSLAQVRAAREEAVDYIAFGPVYGTRSKAEAEEPRGLALLGQAVRAAASLPVVAIGGLGAGRCAAALRAGACAVAVISAVAGAADPVGATKALCREVEGALG